MKKVLTALIACLMMFVMPMGILAEEGNTTLENNPEEGIVELYANVTSSYAVKFPTRVDVTPTSKDFNVYVMGDIASDETLTIGYDDSETINLDDGNGTAKSLIPLAINVTGNSFGFDELPAEFDDLTCAQFNVSHEAITAGSYTADLPLVIELS